MDLLEHLQYLHEEHLYCTVCVGGPCVLDVSAVRLVIGGVKELTVTF